MPPLIAFDLDGTLVDSRRDLAESANELLSLYGAAPLAVDTIVAMVGEGARVLVARAAKAAGIAPPIDDALRVFLEIYDRRLVEHTRPYAGIEAVLAAAASQAHLALLTNKPAHHTTRLLDALDLTQWFPAGIIGGDTPVGRKPDPAGLRSLMAAVGAAAGQTLMVGDSPVDVETGVRAGTHVCVAGYGFGGATPADAPAGTSIVVAATVQALGERLAGFVAACQPGPA